MRKVVDLGVVSTTTRANTPEGPDMDGLKAFSPKYNRWVYFKIQPVPPIVTNAPVG